MAKLRAPTMARVIQKKVETGGRPPAPSIMPI